jgi:hypothetical protein
MKITRLLLGVVAPLALAMPALAEQPRNGDQPAPAAIVGAPSDGATATAPAAQAVPRAKHTVALGPEGTDDSGRTGRIHTVVRGDTLWDISEAYLGTAWVWPSIWKENPRVANPNRIYPGNRLWIAPGEMRQLTDDEAAKLTNNAQPPASTGDASGQPLRVVQLAGMEQIDYIDAQHLESAGSLLGSPEQEKMLAAYRRAYVGLGEGQVAVGDRFTIVREGNPVRDPATNRVLGYHIDKLGWLEITKVGPEASEAMIRESWSDIVRGDRLVPFVDPPKEVAVHPSTTAVEGQILMMPEDRKVTAHFDIVYLNRGSDQGLEVGNPLEIYEPGAMAEDVETKIDHRLPDNVVANLIVITVQPETSVALVTHVNRELQRGDTFRPADGENTSFGAAQSAPLGGEQWTARTLEKSAPAKSASPAKIASPAKAAHR